MKPKSPEQAANQVLGVMSVEDIKAFLLDSINLPDAIAYPEDRLRFRRWVKRWQRLFVCRTEDAVESLSMTELERFAPELRTGLRRVWDEGDSRQRDWYFYRLRDGHHRMIVRAENPSLISVTDSDAIPRLKALERQSKQRRNEPGQRTRFFDEWAAGTDLFAAVPKIGPFEAAMHWLQVNRTLAVYCKGPICAAPYFFREEKGQRFCSPECADPARREAKLKWWNESPNSPKNRVKST